MSKNRSGPPTGSTFRSCSRYAAVEPEWKCQNGARWQGFTSPLRALASSAPSWPGAIRDGGSGGNTNAPALVGNRPIGLVWPKLLQNLTDTTNS
jgi:hypothetical protein